MKWQSKHIIIFLLVIATGCHRQKLGVNLGVDNNIPISVDWSEANLTSDYLNNMSVYFFAEDGSAPYIKYSSSIDSTNVSLPEGTYSVLIINEFVEDLTGLSFSNTDSYQNFTARAILSSSTSLYYDLDSSETLYSAGERLAAWRLDNFEVIRIGECCCSAEYTTSESLLDLQPTPVTALNTITVRMENLNNASTIEGILKGSATSALLSTNVRIDTESDSTIYAFYFVSRSYDDSSDPVDGTTYTTLITFGKQPLSSASYELELNIILGNGELTSFSRDVTDQVLASDDFNIIINLTDSSTLITLPESTGTGFGVEDWGDSEDFDLN